MKIETSAYPVPQPASVISSTTISRRSFRSTSAAAFPSEHWNFGTDFFRNSKAKPRRKAQARPEPRRDPNPGETPTQARPQPRRAAGSPGARFPSVAAVPALPPSHRATPGPRESPSKPRTASTPTAHPRAPWALPSERFLPPLLEQHVTHLSAPPAASLASTFRIRVAV